jgi:transcriptional regulator with XRE-family HTH domain
MFAKRLKKLRLKNKLTQKELAIKLNMTENSIGNYEKGIREPEQSILVELAKIFDVTTDYLLGRVDFENHIVLEGTALPLELQGIIEQIGIAKDAGISAEDIREILDFHIKLTKSKKK